MCDHDGGLGRLHELPCTDFSTTLISHNPDTTVGIEMYIHYNHGRSGSYTDLERSVSVGGTSQTIMPHNEITY